MKKAITEPEILSTISKLITDQIKNDDIDKVFHIRKDFNETFKEAIYPIVKAFEAALNSTLLLEGEKRNYFFEFDVKEFSKLMLCPSKQLDNEDLQSNYMNEERRES